MQRYSPLMLLSQRWAGVTSALVRISWTLILSLAVLAFVVWGHIIHDLTLCQGLTKLKPYP